MLRLVLFVLTVTLGSIAPALAQSEALPAVDANFRMAPLSVDQLDPAERANYAALAPGSDDARKFLYTRGYLRFARLVVDGTLPPPQLPDLPAAENWHRNFLSPEEGRIVDRALHRFLRDPDSREMALSP